MKSYSKYLIVILFCLSQVCVGQTNEELFDKYNQLGVKLLEVNADTSLKYSLKVLELANKINKPGFFVTAYITLGNSYARLYNFNKATEFYLKGLKIVEDKKFKKRAAILGNLGNIYMRQERLEEGFEFFNKEYLAGVEENDFIAQINALVNVCDYYNTKDLTDSSIAKLSLALKIALKNKIDQKISIIYDNLATAYFSKAEESKSNSDFETVKQYAERALQMHFTEKDSAGVAFIYSLLGATHSRTHNFKEAESYYLKAQDMCIHMHDILGLKTGYIEMSDMYAAQKKFEKALICRAKYDSINRLYLNEESSRQVQELNTKYQTEKKDQENQLLTTKNILSEEIIKRQKITVTLIVIGLLGLFIISAFIYKSLKNQKKANELIAKQKEEVELQKLIVDEKNKEITDSIIYAKRIQNAMLTSDAYIKKCVKEHFIFYKPKDIVSGDFYWAFMHSGKFVLATADCTGHGVPGAMMSMLGINLFNHIVSEQNISSPDEILNDLRKEIIKALNPEDSKEESNDGMDCTLLVIDFDTLKMEYASANNSFYIIRERSLSEYKSDKMPVGKSPKENIPFKLHSIQLEKGDILITLTDGYPDQFGGQAGKKFKYKQLESILTDQASRTLPEMKQALESSFDKWKGKLEQVDDVCVIGIKI